MADLRSKISQLKPSRTVALLVEFVTLVNIAGNFMPLNLKITPRMNKNKIYSKIYFTLSSFKLLHSFVTSRKVWTHLYNVFCG